MSRRRLPAGIVCLHAIVCLRACVVVHSEAERPGVPVVFHQGEANTWMALGDMHAQSGSIKQARAHYQNALTAFRELKDVQTQVPDSVFTVLFTSGPTNLVCVCSARTSLPSVLLSCALPPVVTAKALARAQATRVEDATATGVHTAAWVTHLASHCSSAPPRPRRKTTSYSGRKQ